jgi:dTDP-4-dehydrorhamnose 3,5-epimerase
MNIKKTALPDVLVIEPEVFSDQRGYFMETFNSLAYRETGIKKDFVQDNVSFSKKSVLRGLHFQYPHPQGKLVQVVIGEVMDVAVDIRTGSPTFGKWVSETLSEVNNRQIYIPPGFAHGFYVISHTAVFQYKCTDLYNPSADGGILWNDPDINIDWPSDTPVLSDKDARLPRLKDIPPDKLPRFEAVS